MCSLNNYAWFLASCPQIEFRDPAKSIKLAQEAISLAPDQWEYWNTLGVARYRPANGMKRWRPSIDRASWGAGATPSTFSSSRWRTISSVKKKKRTSFT